MFTLPKTLVEYLTIIFCLIVVTLFLKSYLYL